jgi:hypothetical protein
LIAFTPPKFLLEDGWREGPAEAERRGRAHPVLYVFALFFRGGVKSSPRAENLARPENIQNA